MDINPSDAVARLQRIQFKNGNIGPISTSRDYIAGQFYRAMKAPNLTARTIKVGALVFRDDMVAVAKENMLLKLHDRICTGPGTIAQIEFLIGGRVGINESTETIIDTERSVVDGHNGVKRTTMKVFSQLLKLDAKALKQPLEIQTNGGTMAIKG